jgi:hypothetical protein
MNIVRFNNALRESRSSPQADSAATASGDKRHLDVAPPDPRQPLTQRAVDEASGKPKSERSENIAAVYKRATLATGLGSRLLPDGSMAIEQVKPPDFADLDRCVQELSDLGAGPPVGLVTDDTDETLHDPAPSVSAKTLP